MSTRLPGPVIGRALDRAIGVFAPGWEAKRMRARLAVDRARSAFAFSGGASYAAAKTNLATGSWLSPDSHINDLISASSGIIRARARQLVRDMPAMATAVRRLEEFTVGHGITYKPRVLDPGAPVLNRRINQQIEDAWKFWCDEADDTGILHFHDIQALCARNEAEVGEYLIVLKRSFAQGRYLPFSLVVKEVDELSHYGTPLYDNRIFEGVEYNVKTGRPVAYHFEDQEAGIGRTWRVPADRVVLGYKTVRPGQLRGVSDMAPAILLAHSLRDFVEAEVEAAQKAARWLAFVTTPDPAASMSAFGFALDVDEVTPNDHAKYVAEMGNAVVDFLKTGENVTIASHNRPGESFTPFTKWALRSFAAQAGVTYELISGDYENAMYTGARVSRNDMLAGVDVRRARLVRRLCERTKREFLDWAVLAGKVDIPTYYTDPAPFQRGVWQGPGMAYLDPLREGRAHVELVSNKLESPQEVLLARGADPDRVLDDLAEWKEMLADRDLDEDMDMDEGAGGSSQTNPAAVAPGTGDGDGQDDNGDDRLFRALVSGDEDEVTQALLRRVK